MFRDNFLWCILGQNEGNEIYSLSAGYSGTGKQGWFEIEDLIIGFVK